MPPNAAARSDQRKPTKLPVELGQIQGPLCHDGPQYIRGYGSPTSQVVFIGIAPGGDEVPAGRPLVGPSGQLFDAILEAIGVARTDVYTTNLICWWNNEPSSDEIQGCAERLGTELRMLRPKLVVLLGAIVTETFYGKDSFTWRRGRTTWDEGLGAYVLPTYHPAAVLRGNPYIVNDIVRDFKKIKYVLEEFAPDGHEADVSFRVPETLGEAQSVLDNLPRSTTGSKHPVTLDIETNYGQEGIDVFAEDLLCVGLSWGRHHTVVITGDLAKQLNWSGVADTVWWTLQNGVFDWGGMKKWCKVSLTIREDTMYESYMLDERQGVHRLELLGGEDCAATMWKQELRKYDEKVKYRDPDTNRVRTKTVSNVPLGVLHAYNAKDGAYTWRVHRRKQLQLDEDNVRWPYENIMMPAANAFAEIQYRGCYVNPMRIAELGIEWIPRMDANELRLQALARQYGWDHPRELLITSTKDMAEFLFTGPYLQLPWSKRTPTGAPSTEHEVLEALYTVHEFPKEVVEHRQLQKVISTYLNGIDARVRVDGMLHPSALLHGAQTGRLSYQDPNLQNIPQDYTVGADLARVREIFEPCPWYYDTVTLEPMPSKGHREAVVLEADHKQIELWCGYYMSGDPEMKKGLDSGDFHRMTAVDVYNKTWDEVVEWDRFRTKMVTFGRMYRRGADSLTRGRSSLQCTVAEAAEWIRKWSAKYQVYELWAKGIEYTMINEGEIVSPTGRKRRYPLVMGEEAHHMLRSGVNYPIQSAASDYTLTSLIELHHRLKQYDTWVMFTVHDSIVFDVNVKYFDEVVAIITEVMCRPKNNWPTPMPSIGIDIKTGPSWGKCLKACKTCNKLYPQVIVQELSLPNGGKLLKCTSCQAQALQQVAA